jgi:hypothetical protein
VIAELPGSLLVLGMLALLAARAAPPLAAKVEGTPILEVPLPFLYRLLDQRVNILAILGVLGLGSGLVGDRWIPHGLFVFALVVIVGVLLIPRHYRFTTAGVSPNRATFRAWPEFSAWQTSGNVVRLEGAERFSSLRLYVATNHRDGVIRLLNRYVPGTRPASSTRVPKSTRPKGAMR